MSPKKPGSFKLALAQMLVTGADLEGNLRQATQMIAAAATAGAQVVLLSEALDIGWTDPSSRRLAERVPDGRACRAFREAAREFGLYVCAGLTERAEESVYNAAVLISPRGQLLLYHRK